MSVGLLFVRLKDRFHVLGHLSKWFTFFRIHGPVSSSHNYQLGSNYFKTMYAKNLRLTFSGIAFQPASKSPVLFRDSVVKEVLDLSANQ